MSHRLLGTMRLTPDVHRLEVRAPRVAAVGRPGQFVIVHLGPGAERIPITIADADPEKGAVSLIVQAVGKSTKDLVALRPGGEIADVAGPLGRPSEIASDGHAVCVAGGVGAAVVFPIARALRRGGATVTTVLGARSRQRVILEDELAKLGPVLVCTEDGSYGHRGLVTAVLPEVLASREVAAVYAAGPVRMMQAVAELTRPLGIRTIVSLNPIMVDGTGMCGGCRVTVAGTMRFACVDGPEFDGHEVDFDELADRLTTYCRFEREALRRMEAAP